MTRRVLLVRHCEVAAEYRGVCYGRADVRLSPLGISESVRLAESLASPSVTRVYHSGRGRTLAVADPLGDRLGIAAVECPELAERDYGGWELRTWDAIYAETGDAMMGTVQDPAGWRPPGGETTFEMRDRVMAWYAALPPTGVIVAVTHGGPIAALVGALAGRPVADWPGLVPPTGAVVELADAYRSAMQ